MSTYYSLLLMLWTMSSCMSARTPLAEFEERIEAYMKLRKEAEADAGSVVASRSAANVNQQQRALSEAIRTRRAEAAKDVFFPPPVAAEFRRLIRLNLKHRANWIRQSIRTGGTVAATTVVNGAYPEGLPVETMPPTLLMAFPKLPRELDYRFVGTTLLLRDVTANLILGLIPNAITPE